MSAFAKPLRLIASIISVLLLIAAVFAGWFYFQVRGSLPQLDGTRAISGLSAPVSVTKDALGVPTVKAKTRNDAARALGFVHAQDRFFQMDLLRRRAAGELAALIGRAALPLDRSTRPHRFRELARNVFTQLPPDKRALLENYTSGVNAGLEALGKKPFEYYVLRDAPQPWTAEDSVLVIYAMTLDLQDPTNKYERSLMTLRDAFGTDAVGFFAPLLTPDDAALDGSTGKLPPIPGPNVLDLRDSSSDTKDDPSRTTFLPSQNTDDPVYPGSNSFALTGNHTASGAALLANDPHLNLAMPNIWYRAVLEWSDPTTSETNASSSLHRVVGVTLPGLPFVVLGSNGHVAWGLTVAYADTDDLVTVDVNPVSPDVYKLPGSDELVPIEKRRDVIKVKGGADEVVETRWTRWGPVIGADARERPLAHHWIAYDPQATNLRFADLETAATTADAIAIAHDAGMPAHNFLVADQSGAIGWTIAGKIPRRVGFDGRLPVSWSYGDRRWNGFLPAADVPTITNPSSGRLWTANQRMLGGDQLGRIGDGGYPAPFRAAQVRDDLAALEHASPKDLLAVQLDVRAPYLDRWQKRLLSVLTPEAIAEKSSRGKLRELVQSWEGRASADSVSYRLVRNFRNATAEAVFTPIYARCFDRMPDFNWRLFQYEPVLQALLAEKPAHLLSPDYRSWDTLLLHAADDVLEQLKKENTSLAHGTWGARNHADIRHPFSRVLPSAFARWLNLPADPLPGDTNVPRVQSPSYGASMRLVVSPGHEDEGLFEMPGGQSGHPLSPYYRAGHESWVRGEPTPLLPGKPEHTLTLSP
jgi:penicillin amidase